MREFPHMNRSLINNGFIEGRHEKLREGSEIDENGESMRKYGEGCCKSTLKIITCRQR